jgi:hypothetical protein
MTWTMTDIPCAFCGVLFRPASQPVSVCSLWCQAWVHVDRSNPTGCWPWSSCRTIKNYGELGHKGQKFAAHRVIAGLTIGPVDGFVVMHTCDNPPCCNPGHLRIGSTKDNVIDMCRKGRHPRQKLTADGVRQIRSLAANGMSKTDIMQNFKVSEPCVRAVLSGRSWGYVEKPT